MKRRILSLLLCLCMVTSNLASVPFALAEEEPAIEVTIEEAAEPAAEIVIEKPAEEPTEEPAEEPTEEPVEELTEKPAEEPTEEPVEEPTEEPVEEPTEEPAEEPTEEPAEEPTEEPAEEPIEEELLPEIVVTDEEEEALLPEGEAQIPEEDVQILEGEAVLDVMDAASDSWKAAPWLHTSVVSGGRVTLDWEAGSTEMKSFRVFEYVNGSPSWRATTTNTTYTMTGVPNGSHTYVVTPYDPSTGAYGTQSNTMTVTVENSTVDWKAAPTINSITVSGSSVTLKWTAGSSEKKSFRIFEYVNGSPSWRATTTATSYTLTGVSNGTHTYVVTPYEPATQTHGTQSAKKSVTVGSAATSWKAAPTINSITASGNSVTLKWTAGSSEKKSFRVFEYVNGSPSWRATTTNTSCTLTGVTNGTHIYVVTPYDPSAGAYGTQSAKKSVTVGSAATGWKAAPTISSITASGSSVTLKWTAGSSEKKSFRIFEYVNGAASWRATTTNTSYTLTGVANGTHTYVVTPYDPSTATYGTQSAKKSVTVSAVPTWQSAPTINSITASGSSVTLKWTAGSSEKKSFRIFEYVNGAASWRATTTNTSYTLTGVANGTHTYVVTPYDPSTGTYGTQSAKKSVTISVSAANPTLSNYRLNGYAGELTVAIGDTLTFGGTITADPSLDIVDVQVSVFLHGDHSKGAVYTRAEDIYANTFSLSKLPAMTVGKTYNGFTMQAGKSYDVMLYVTDEYYKGFTSDPYITVHVAAAVPVLDMSGAKLNKSTYAPGETITISGIRVKNADYVHFSGNNGYISAKDVDVTYSSSYATLSNVTLSLPSSAATGSFYISVTACDDEGNESAIDKTLTYTVAKNDLPATPTGVTAAVQSSSSIKVSWTKVTGATGYYVYRSTSSSGTYSKVKTITSGSTVNYTDTGLSADTKYYYKVSAYNANGESALSAYDYDWTDAAAVPVLDMSGAKLNKSTYAPGETITISGIRVKNADYVHFSGNNGYISAKDVDVTYSSSYATLSNVTLSLPSSAATGSFYISVTACDDEGNESAIDKTLTYTVAKNDLPATPTGVTAAVQSSSSIKVSWTKVTGATGYYVYRSSSSGGTYSKVKTITSGSTVSYTDTGLSADTKYYYKVSAYNANGESALSAYDYDWTDAAAVPVLDMSGAKLNKSTYAPGETITISGIRVKNADYVHFSGNNGYISAKDVDVTYSSSYATLSNVTLSLPSSTVTGSFYISVTACDDEGNESAIDKTLTYTVEKNSAPATPTGVTAVAQSSSSIKVSWTKVTEATGYYVYRSSSSSGTYSKVKTITFGSTVSYTDTGLSADTKYYYKVSAYNANGESAKSAYDYDWTDAEAVPELDMSNAQLNKSTYAPGETITISGIRVKNTDYVHFSGNNGYLNNYTGTKDVNVTYSSSYVTVSSTTMSIPSDTPAGSYYISVTACDDEGNASSIDNSTLKYTITKSSSSTTSSVALDVPYYMQTDSRWKDVYIDTKTIGAVGCTTTCMAMIYSYKQSEEYTPDEMVDILSYSGNDLLWSSVTSLGFKRTICSRDGNSGISQAYMKEIYNALQADKPVMVGATSSSTSTSNQHWIVVTGYNGAIDVFDASGFEIQDPSSTSRNTLQEFLNYKPYMYMLVY